MSMDDGFQSLSLQIGPGQTARIQQHLLNISSQGIAVPKPEVEDFMPAKKKALQVERRERMVNTRNPMWHAHVIGVFRFELEFEKGAGSLAHKSVPFAS